jgi:hypothetical protein
LHHTLGSSGHGDGEDKDERDGECADGGGNSVDDNIIAG